MSLTRRELACVLLGGAVTFHVEIYPYPFDSLKVAKTVDEWHLPSDPWTFIVDKTGVVRDRFEGAAPIDELEPSVKSVLV